MMPLTSFIMFILACFELNTIPFVKPCHEIRWIENINHKEDTDHESVV